MPTPESEAFLKKKPTVPPTFDGVDFLDGKAVADARDAILKEQWIQIMMANLVRDELGKCYRREGVNHLLNCGKYRDRYLQLLMQNRARGYRGQQQNYMRHPIGYNEVLKADVQEDYPTVQQAKGVAGVDKRPGYTTGFGPNGWGRF